MTKYVLNSGGIGNNSEKAKKFFEEVVKGLGKDPKILLCCFATLRENWEEKYVEYVQKISQYLPNNIKPTFELALPDTFEQQVGDCDVLYVYGGDDHLVQYWLKKFDIPKIWEGKVVATNSASSNALSKYFWTCDWRSLMEGLGILQIKFLPHFKSDYGATDPRGPIDWNKAYEELKNGQDTTLPIYALEEGDFVVITL